MPVLSLENINTAPSSPVPIPNKHLPTCPAGPIPIATQQPDTPPASPPTKHNDIPSQSILHPPDQYTRFSCNGDTIYSIDAATVAEALDHISGQALPDSSQVFPWLHGLHPQNQVQQAFFVARRRSLRRTPRCLRGITLVKADGDLSRARLKGAISPDEFLQEGEAARFKEIDPPDGFSVRNFQIQACKTAMVSDIIVYGEHEDDTQKKAFEIAAAQRAWKAIHDKAGHELPIYNTFVCTSSFERFHEDHPEIVMICSKGQATGKVLDFFYQERLEMSSMTAASEIAHNIWLGPTPDIGLDPALLERVAPYDIMIECNDLGRFNTTALEVLVKSDSEDPIYLEFPSSGSIMPPAWSLAETEALVSCIQNIHALATGTLPHYEDSDVDSEGDSQMSNTSPRTRSRKILFHCTDGYTETSLLALAYYIYANGCTVSEAWLQLHTIKKRNFFAYPSDLALLNAITPRLLACSPAIPAEKRTRSEITIKLADEADWLENMDGSLPSRITDYMYLGNLGHANNPKLLKAMRITQILSVGEQLSWTSKEEKEWGDSNILKIQGVQDNGVDELWGEIERCLDFIGRLDHESCHQGLC